MPENPADAPQDPGQPGSSSAGDPVPEPDYSLAPPRVPRNTGITLWFLGGALILIALSFGIGIGLGMMDPLGLEENTAAEAGNAPAAVPAESQPIGEPEASPDAPE